jgi:hypothetical protein
MAAHSRESLVPAPPGFVAPAAAFDVTGRPVRRWYFSTFNAGGRYMIIQTAPRPVD